MIDIVRSHFGRLSFRWKAIIFIASVEGLFNIMFAFIVVGVMQNNLEEQFFKRAQITTQLFATTTANAVLATDIASLESFVNEVMENKDLLYARVRDSDDVLAEGAHDPTLLSRPFDADTSLSLVNDGIFDTFAIIEEDGEVFGRVEVGLSTELLGSTITDIQLKVILIGAGEILFSAIVSFLLGAFLVGRLVALQNGAHRIAEGEIGFQIAETGRDEIAQTAAAFNNMSIKTAELIKALRDALKQVNFQKFAMDQHAIISIADIHGNITYVNDKFCESSQYAPEELIGQNHRIIKSDEHPDSLFKEIWLKIVNGKVWHGELKNRAKDNSSYWVESTIVPFLDDQNNPFQYVSIRTDITKRKRMEAELSLAKEVAEKASIAKSEFLATMSHEIRTPMNGVIGMTGLLLDTDLNDEQRHFAETIRFSGESLLLIINDILDFSKLEAGKMKLESSPFTLSALIEGVIEILAPKAHGAGLDINYIMPPELQIRVLGDSGRLRQILMNLAGNAIKFTHEGGVFIEVKPRSKTLRAVKLRFEIRDTGIGIDEEHRAELFQSFTQVDTSTARKFGGTGLGLAICKQLVEAMEGEIGVDSEPSTGSTFWFEVDLPIERRKRCFDPEAFVEEFKRLRVLILDDNSVNCEIFQRTLSYWSLASDTASEPHKAVDMARQAATEGQPYDFILTDFQMPKGNGIDFMREIRTLEAYRKTPMVLSSSVVLSEDLREEAAILAYRLLAKPVRHSELFDALVMSLGLRQVSNERRYVKAKAEAKVASSLRILVAEDNIVNQQVAKGLLEKLGHRVDVAANGHEALEALKRIPYDLLFMDMQMPEMDGLQATRAIRKLGGDLGRTPIIAMTANALKEAQDQCFEAGMNDYLSKPVNRNKLSKLIASMFSLDVG